MTTADAVAALNVLSEMQATLARPRSQPELVWVSPERLTRWLETIERCLKGTT